MIWNFTASDAITLKLSPAAVERLIFLKSTVSPKPTQPPETSAPVPATMPRSTAEERLSSLVSPLLKKRLLLLILTE